MCRLQCTCPLSTVFFFTAPSPSSTYPLSLHDALPICPSRRGGGTGVPGRRRGRRPRRIPRDAPACRDQPAHPANLHRGIRDRKSTRLNSSHVATSYAVFCLKKKTFTDTQTGPRIYSDS